MSCYYYNIIYRRKRYARTSDLRKLLYNVSNKIDRVKRQEIIDFEKMQSDYYCVYKADSISGNSDDAYDDQKCFVLWYTKFNATEQIHTDTGAYNQNPMSLEKLRGGYRPLSDDDDPDNGLDYDAGCKQGYYLKKKKYRGFYMRQVFD